MLVVSSYQFHIENVLIVLIASKLAILVASTHAQSLRQLSIVPRHGHVTNGMADCIHRRLIDLQLLVALTANHVVVESGVVF